MSDRNIKEQNEENYITVVDKDIYISRQDAMNLLGCNKSRFYGLYKKVFTSLVYEGMQLYLLRKEVEAIKSASVNFKERYCPAREAMLRLGLDVNACDSYTRLSKYVDVIDCPDAMKLLAPKGSSKFCRIEDVERHLQTRRIIDTTRYITIKEAISILGCSEVAFMGYYKKIFRSCILSKETADTYTKRYMLNEEVDLVKLAYEKLKEKYRTTDETAKYLNYNMTKKDGNNISYVKKYLQVIDCPEYARLFIEHNQGLCLIEDVKQYYQSRNKRRLDVIPDNPVLHLEKAIETYIVKPYQEETRELFKKYLVQKLTMSQASKKTKEANISRYLGILRDTLLACKIVKPISSFTTDEVNLLLSMETRCFSYSEECYLFVEFCSKYRTCRFDMRRVEKPKKGLSNMTADDIYDETQFSKTYAYGTNINLHISNAIKSYKYASTWLYILMHFSNAWRHTDVIQFPPIYPEALKIFDLAWFENNRLKISEGQLIINQVKNYKLQISKTGLRRHFFCNIDLILPIPTSRNLALE